MIVPPADRLARLASEYRALARTLEVACPDKYGHPWARVGVPCYEPSEDHPRGWVCIRRMGAEAHSRPARAFRAREQKVRARNDEFRARKERRATRKRIAIIESIHAAARKDVA